MITAGGKAKIFDFEKQSVLHFFKESKDYEETKQIYSLFSPFFEIPAQEFVDEELLEVPPFVKTRFYELSE